MLRPDSVVVCAHGHNTLMFFFVFFCQVALGLDSFGGKKNTVNAKRNVWATCCNMKKMGISYKQISWEILQMNLNTVIMWRKAHVLMNKPFASQAFYDEPIYLTKRSHDLTLPVNRSTGPHQSFNSST